MFHTQEHGEKPHFRPGFWSKEHKFWSPFFFKNLASSVYRYHDELSSCTMLEKTNNPILRKFPDGLTDTRTERRTKVIS